jgi:hypothetical protein
VFRHDSNDYYDLDLQDFENPSGSNVGSSIRLLIRNRSLDPEAAKGSHPRRNPGTERRNVIERQLPEKTRQQQAALRKLADEKKERREAQAATRKLFQEMKERREAVISRQNAALQGNQKCATDVRQASDKIAKILSEFLDVKYRKITTKIELAARSLNLTRKQYFMLSLLLIQLRMKALSDNFSHLITQINAVYEPRASAQRRIDNILTYDLQWRRYYADCLQAPFRTQVDLAHDFVQSCDHFLPSRPPQMDQILKKLIKTSLAIQTAAHGLRNWYLLQRLSESQYPDAWCLKLISSLGSQFTSRFPKLWLASANALLARSYTSFSTSGAKRTPYETLLTKFLMPRLQPGLPHRNPRLDIFWRQQDVLAPFDLYLRKLRELRCLLHIKRQIYRKSRYFQDLDSALFRLDRSATQFTAEMTSYTLINWLRLESETKLDKFGLTAPTIARGLFTVRRPLSQDPKLFSDWLRKAEDSRIMSTYYALLYHVYIHSDNRTRSTYFRKKAESFYAKWFLGRQPIPSRRGADVGSHTTCKPADLPSVRLLTRSRVAFGIQSTKPTFSVPSRLTPKADHKVKRPSAGASGKSRNRCKRVLLKVRA